MFKVAETGKS